METKTLLTVVALLIAGMLTIMLARGDDRREEDVFLANPAETGQMDNAVVYQATRSSDRTPRSQHNASENYQGNYEAMAH